MALISVIAAQTLIAQQPASETATPRADWPVFAAKQMPPGKFVTEADIAKLADAGGLQGVLYLVGSFNVTARADDRVVLRFDGEFRPIRIVAVYPPSIPTPAEGTKLVRDESRGFKITDIRRGKDGQVTVYVREITMP